jgi:hypothetical protein
VDGIVEAQGTTHTVSEYYARATRALADGRWREVSLDFDLVRVEFTHAWHAIYLEVKDRPREAPVASRTLIIQQPRAEALALAMARCDAGELFRDFKRLLEFVTRKTEGVPGYAAASAVPNVLAGFLYMSAAVGALQFEAWEALRELLNSKFEYGQASGRPRFSHGFDHSYFFHSEAFGHDATRIHDLFRELISSADIVAATGLEDQSLLDCYVQTQMLMCFKAAQFCEHGEDMQLWADFGRFHGWRVAPLFERIAEDPAFAAGLMKSFGESPEEFLGKVNPRLAFIRKHFWTSGRYFFESLNAWEPSRQ